MSESTIDQQAPKAPRREATMPAPGWSLAWLAMVGGGGGLIGLLHPESADQIGRVIVAMAAPAVPGLFLRRHGSPAMPTVLLALWAAGAGVACTIGGGISAPVAAWCLAPVAAAAAMGGQRRMAQGAALAFLVAALVAMIELSEVAPPPPETGAAFWLGLLALFSTGLGLGAGLILRQREAADVTAAELARLNDLIAALGHEAVTERERAVQLDQARADAEKLAAGKARFLANMSHELRTPLNAIMGFSDIMRTRMFGPLPDKYAEYGALIHESGSHLLDLINDVLDMSKIEAERYELTREIFDGREAVSAALRLLRVQADGIGVQLRGVLPPSALPIDADRRALKQIVLNLVSNALKFTPKGGSVTVTAHGYDGVFELVVADNGVGISKADLERLGRPFEQADAGRRAQGTGLGLSLVRSFAELHGGEMVIESNLGEGATVSVRLPVLKALPEPAPPPPETMGENVVAFAPQR